MTLTSLDKIVRLVLLRKRYPLQWYIDCLVAAKYCLETLTKDDLRVINTQLIPVNDFGEAELPSDFLDFTLIGIQNGQFIRPLVERKGINPLANYNATFDQIRYDDPSGDDDSEDLYYGALFSSVNNTVTWNNFGEDIGRRYGLGPEGADTFIIVPDRNVIQLNESLNVDEIVCQYVSDGSSANAATQIDKYATETIVAYIEWQLKEHRRDINEGEKMRAEQAYIAQRKILRARKSDLDINVLKRIVQKRSIASPK
jgi:hypothetical protein